MYSLFRKDTLQEAYDACPLTDQWGSDMSFVLGALARGGLCIDRRVLLRKRIVRNTDTPDRIDTIVVRRFETGTFDLLHAYSYIRNNLRAVSETPYYWLTLAILLKRLPLSLADLCLRPFYSLSRRLSGRPV
jgi:hypothetical protein